MQAAATIGELPSPASFVYTPRATPILIAVINEITAVPAVPPSTDSLENAHAKMRPNVAGITLQFHTRIRTDPPTKKSAMKGTINSATLEMDLIPPNVTTAVIMVIIAPTSNTGR